MVTEPNAAFVRAIATYGIDGIDRAASPLAWTEELSWSVVRSGIVRDRLTGMAALMADDGGLVLPEEERAELAEIDQTWARHTLAAEDVLLTVVDDLDAAGIDSRVLKGSALADLDWRWPQARRWVDADVLVSTRNFGPVVARLEQAGAVRQAQELRRGFDRRFAKTVTLVSAAGPEIDLHRSLILGPHTFLIPTDDLFREPRHFQVEGRELAAMGIDATLVHVCMHACFAGATRLASLRDVVEVAATADLDRAAAIARRWQITPALTAAADAVADRLGLADHPFVHHAATLRVTPAETRIAEVYAPGQRTSRNLALSSLRHIPGVGDKARFAYAFAVPDATNRTERGRSRRDQARRIIGRMRPGSDR